MKAALDPKHSFVVDEGDEVSEGRIPWRLGSFGHTFEVSRERRLLRLSQPVCSRCLDFRRALGSRYFFRGLQVVEEAENPSGRSVDLGRRAESGNVEQFSRWLRGNL